MEKQRILITGGAGFIAHHLIDHLIRNTNWEIVILDKLTYAANGFDRLREIGAYGHPRVTAHPVDLCYRIGEGLEREIGHVDYFVHMAAETHVDNSIANPRLFVEANVVGTFEMLELARRLTGLKKFLYFSTDEVFGPAPDCMEYKEWDGYNSNNPYAATKAAGEELTLAWANTYKLPAFITHTMNAFGERQHPEKFIPKVISHVMMGKTIPIHAYPDKKRSGSRFYIHCRNIADAVLFLLDRADFREKYNIVGEQEVNNLDLAKRIASIIGKPLKYELVDFHSARPGHDLRYALNGGKMRGMNWFIPMRFEESLTRTIRWMTRPEHYSWLDLGTHAAVAG
jgi:dTDP-glucose 4,6-dehydratase